MRRGLISVTHVTIAAGVTAVIAFVIALSGCGIRPSGPADAAVTAPAQAAAGAVIDASAAAWSLSMTRQPTGRWQKLASMRVLRCTAAMRRNAGGQWQVVGLTLH